ncbi:MAG: transcriptional regulator [Micromonospora sp.]
MVRATVGVLLFLIGVPALLWIVGGDPVRRLPTWPQVAVWFNESSGRFTPQLLTGVAIWALWLVWAAFALLLVSELLAASTRWRIPALRLPAPMHRLVFGLAGTAAIAVTSVGRLDATVGGDVSPAVVASTEGAGAIPLQAVARGPATIRVGNTSYVYTVERHDTLSKVARDWLGDADRWPEICRLNKHRHWPGVGGTLRDCDLIYPGWELRLPAGARPPAAARPAPSPQRPGTDPDVRRDQPAPPRPSSTAPMPDRSNKASPGPTVATSGSTVRPGRTSSDHDRAGTDRGRSPTADDGVHLSDGAFVPWALAVAINAAAALVWLQRRRRYIPGTADLEPDDLPTTIKEIRRQVLRPSEPPTVDDLAARAAAVAELPVLPPRGVGLVGGGAHAAARAALTTILAAGGPREPDRRAVVVIDRPTLAALLGPDPTEPWDRLHVVDDLDAALAAVETQLLHRARIRDEGAAADQVPADPSPAPMVLLTAAPPQDARDRTRVVLNLGAELGITAVLLGQWPHGATIDVSVDGTARSVTGQPGEFFGERAALLDRDSAVAILQTLREAHTGEPPSEATTDAQSADAASEAGAGEAGPVGDTAQGQTPVAAEIPRQMARLRVLGAPRVDAITWPGRPLRSKAAELAVYLACHPDGADTATIAEYLVPDARLRAARQQVHTNVSNLRHVLARAGGPRPGGYLLKPGANGRYRLDPATVDVDLWRLRDLLRRAPLASGPARIELLREACALYTAPLADGCDYEWVDSHREKARRWGVEAHALLADELLDTDPRAASDLLDKAIGIDRYNEELYRRAIRARHILGDSDGVQAFLRALSTALADLDARFSEATVSLAQELGASPQHL